MRNEKMDPNESPLAVDRRTLLKMGALGAGAAVLSGCRGRDEGESATADAPGSAAAPEALFAAPPLDTVRIGFVGIGGMGSVHVRNLLDIEGVEMTALCDIRPEHAERARDWVVEAGGREPTLYTRGETDFIRMCEAEDIDLVYTATPWRWHVPVWRGGDGERQARGDRGAGGRTRSRTAGGWWRRPNARRATA